MFPKQHILRINETTGSNSAGKRATLHERGWRPCEPAQGGSCGILISSCGIKVRIWGRQNFYMTPITMGCQLCAQAIIRGTNAIGDRVSSSGVANVEF